MNWRKPEGIPDVQTILGPLHAALPTLLYHLGFYSSLDSLLALPQLSAADANQLRQSRSTDRYHVQLQSQCLTLTLQCMQPEAPPHEGTWGLQGITLNVLTWQGKQPERAGSGQDASQVRALHKMSAAEVLALFSNQVDAEDVVNMHPMLCFPYAGAKEQDASVLAIFEQHSKTLRTLSLTNVGSWHPLPPTIAAPAAEEELPAPMAGADPAAFCRSGAAVPKSGIWEGQLPAGHAQAERLKHAPHRFVFKRHGDTMDPLGLPASEEGFVRWVWLREW